MLANILPRSTYFAFILYPDNENHMDVFRYLESHQDQFKPVWILHDAETTVQDVVETDDDGKEISHSVVHEKKAHYHILIKALKQTTCNSIIRSFGGHIEFCLNIYSPSSYIMYMLHDTYNSKCKKQYTPDMLCGDKKMIKKVYSSQNKNFVQLGELVYDIRNGATLTDVVDKVCAIANDSPDADIIEVFERYQYILVAMCSEERFYRLGRGDSAKRKQKPTWCGATRDEWAELYESASID